MVCADPIISAAEPPVILALLPQVPQQLFQLLGPRLQSRGGRLLGGRLGLVEPAAEEAQLGLLLAQLRLELGYSAV